MYGTEKAEAVEMLSLSVFVFVLEQKKKTPVNVWLPFAIQALVQHSEETGKT